LIVSSVDLGDCIVVGLPDPQSFSLAERLPVEVDVLGSPANAEGADDPPR